MALRPVMIVFIVVALAIAGIMVFVVGNGDSERTTNSSDIATTVVATALPSTMVEPTATMELANTPKRVVVISAGRNHALALLQSGEVIAWGESLYGQTEMPVELRDVATLAAGEEYSLALTKSGEV